jgi:hypothetical protein
LLAAQELAAPPDTEPSIENSRVISKPACGGLGAQRKWTYPAERKYQS